jgi:hypothetical protein
MSASFSRCVSVAFVLFVSSAPSAMAGRPPIDTQLAAQYFQEAKALAGRDQGRLWGVTLAGPMMFVEPQSRMIVANQADKEHKLTAEGPVSVGHLPLNESIANNAVHWAGVHWTMVVWPLPANRDDRAVLLMHESWHRIQNQIGFPASFPANAHLDAPEGRFWLQLEWRALAAALKLEARERRDTLEDALCFRARRRELFPQAAGEERSLEMHEGVAEYTGVKLSGLSDSAMRDYARKSLEQRPKRMATFVRSFAYLSGPAYGILLDEDGVPWRKKPAGDFGTMLEESRHIKLAINLKDMAEARALAYEGDILRESETRREAGRQKRIADYRARLIDGPVLVLPLKKAQTSFDPTNLQPLPGRGTVYPNLRISDSWGILTASKGALMSADFSTAYVSAPPDPKSRPLKGVGWQLELNAAWKIEPGRRAGDFVLIERRK